MKKILLIFLSFLIVLSSASLAPINTQTATAESLFEPVTISEFNFEDASLQGWKPRGGVTLEALTEEAHAGAYSLKTTGRKSGWNGPSYTFANPLEEGAVYEFSAYVKRVDASASSQLKLSMLQKKTADGVESYKTISDVKVTTTDWTLLKGQYTFNSEVIPQQLYIEGSNATETFYLDDVKIVMVTPAKVEEPVVIASPRFLQPVNISSFGFENADKQGWISRGGSKVVLEPTKEIAYKGEYSLKTTGRTSGWHGPSYQMKDLILQGAVYEISAYVKRIDATDAATLKLSVEQKAAAGGTSYPTIAQASVSNTDWTLLKGQFSINSDMSSLSLYVESSLVTDSYYIDDINIVMVTPPSFDPVTVAGYTFEKAEKQGWAARGSNVLVESVTEAVYGGEYSLKTSGRTSAWHGASVQTESLLRRGAVYYISGFIKRVDASVPATMKLSMEKKESSGQTTYPTVAEAVVSNANWTFLEGQFFYNSDVDSLILYAESSVPADSFYLDDVKIVMVTPALEEEQDTSPVQVSVDWSAEKQTIDGFGASAAFRMAKNLQNWGTEESRNHILDLLYSPDNGIGLSWIRNMVGDGGLKEDGTQYGQATDGPNPTFWSAPDVKNWEEPYFWDDQIWLMNEAKKRGATHFMSSVWSPPAWMKENNSVINGGALSKDHYQDFADYLVEYIQEYKSRFGIEIAAISPANEPNTVVQYSSSQWTADQLYDFVKNYLVPAFKENNITTDIMLPEAEYFSESLALPVLNDPELSPEILIIAGHDYHKDSAPLPVANAQGKRIWMTEMFPSQGQPRDLTMTSALEWAKYVHKYLTVSNASVVNYWWILNRNTDSNSGLIHLNIADNSSYILSKRLFAFGQYSKFVRPGSVRLDTSPTPVKNVYVSAYKEELAGKISVVIINDNDYEKTVNLGISNFEVSDLTPYITNDQKDLEKGESIQVSNGSFSTVIPAKSIITLIGTNEQLSSEPKLSGLTLSQGSLSPQFSADTLDYTAAVVNEVSSVKVTPTAAERLTIKVNGEEVASGQTSGDISLPVGETVLSVEVTAPNGAKQTYKVTVTRAASESTNPDNGHEPTETIGNNGQQSSQGSVTTSIISSQNTVTAKINASVTNSKVILTLDQLKDAVSKALEAKFKQGGNFNTQLEVNLVGTVNTAMVELSIPREAINVMTEGKFNSMTVSTPNAAISFGSEALSAIANEAKGGDVRFSISSTKVDQLPLEASQIVGDRPAFELNVASGDEVITSFNGNVTVSISYSKKSIEDENALVIYHITDNGKLEPVNNARFNATNNTVTFSTNHFSLYALGYNKVSFQDVADNSWYGKAVTFVASKGIVQGTDEGRYNPDAKLTRGQFIVMLMRAYNIEPEKDEAANFVDAGKSYYSGYLAAAKTLGISQGVGNDKFEPDKAITRQEMAVLLYNTLSSLGKLPERRALENLTEFEDATSIAAWAEEAMNWLIQSGIIQGNDSQLLPLQETKRSEIAQVLYNLL